MIRRLLTATVSTILLTSAAWSQQLEVTVENTTAQTVVRTKSQIEFTVLGRLKITPGAETLSDTRVTNVAVIGVRSPVPGTEVECDTAPLEDLGDGLFMITKPGEHLIRIDAFGVIDKNEDGLIQVDELFRQKKDIVVVVPGTIDPPDEDPDEEPDCEPDEEPDDQLPDAPADGFRALLLFEAEDRGDYPPEVDAVINSTRVAKWLDENTELGPDQWPEWRFVDDDAPFHIPSSPLSQLRQRPRDSLPWLVVTNGGKIVYEGPVPAGIQPTLDLLKSLK